MKWIGKGVLRIGKKRIGYGDDIPKNFPKERIKKLAKKRLIGEIAEPVDPETIKVTSKSGGKSSTKSGS